ncbi:helix-turn-helix transcriptional regulator [Spirillospora sp. NPDC046719]
MTPGDDGPVLSGWLLGNALADARKASGESVASIARDLGVHPQTVRRWENAEVTPSVLVLRGLCTHYGVPPDKRDELEELRERASRPGWWNGSGDWPDATAELLGMEMAAVRIRAWDLTAIPGLLQTPEYARQVIQAVDPSVSPTRVDSGVELRMGRQAEVFGATVREAVFMIDETALARMPGGPALRRAQIARLLVPPPAVTIQVMPFSAGPHPALGSFMAFDFDSDVISAGIFVEGSVTGRSRVETGAAVARYEQVWAWLQAKALTPKQTTEFLEKMMEGIAPQ